MAKQGGYKTTDEKAYNNRGNGHKCKGETFTDRNLIPVKPQNEQFEPTTAEPIRQRARMGGVS